MTAFVNSHRHCEPTGRANARPMTGSAKQSMSQQAEAWIASSLSLLAMTAVRLLATRMHPRSAITSPSRNQRAQGMPGARCTRGLIRKWRRARMSIQAQRRHPASPAQRLYGLCRALPGDEFVLSPSSADSGDRSNPVGPEWSPPTWHQQRVSGPHGFAVRSKRRSFCAPCHRSRGSTRPATAFTRRRSRVHHIPHHVRDDRDTPLLPERDERP